MVIDVTRPKAQGYGVSVGDDWFRLAASPDMPLRVYTRDSLAGRQDQAGSVEENVLDLGYAFSRSNLTGGEGLDWYPRVSGEPARETDDIRFWDSGNIDLSRPRAGAPYSWRLVKDMEDFWTPAGTPVDMGTSRDAVFIIEGTNVHRFDDWGDTTADDTDNLGVTLTQLAVGPDGSVAVLDNTGNVWFKGAQTDTYVEVYDTATDGDAATGVWWVKDRVIVATNDAASAAQGALVEFLPTMGGTPGSPTAVPATYDTFDTFEGQCYDVVDAGHAIVACFSDGSFRSYVPQTDTAGGVPVLTVRGRSQAPTGEVPYRLAHNLGELLIFTLEEQPGAAPDTIARVYKASVLDERFDFVIKIDELVREWFNSKESVLAYTKNVVNTRDEMFFWIGEGTNDWNLWRYDLVSGGLTRHGAHARASAVGTVMFDERLAVCDGADVVIESATDYVPTGYLITPNITFGLNTAINWVSFVIEVLGLDTLGVVVSLYRTSQTNAILDRDSADWILVQNLTDPAQSGLERQVVNATSNSLALKVELTASESKLVTPEVERVAVRGFPKHRDWIAEIPINVSDMVEAHGRMPVRVPGYGDKVHTVVLSKDGAATDIRILDPPTELRGVVDQILEPVTYITDRGSQGKVCMLMFRGNRLTGSTAAAAQGDAGTGIGWTGVSTVGIGEAI